MKTIIKFSPCLLACLMLTGNRVNAAPLSHDLTATFEQHEMNTSRLTLTWKVDHQDVASPERLTSLQNETKSEKQIAEIYRRRGITDERKLQQLVKSAIQAETSWSKVRSHRTSATWRFINNRPSTLVEGSSLTSVGSAPHYRQLYTGPNGLIVDDPTPKNPHMGLLPAMVWNRPTDSRDFPTPIPFGLSLQPEYFTVLAGISPLGMYSAQWTSASDGSNALTLTGKVAQSSDGPMTIQVTLNPSYGKLPSDIKVTADEQPWTRELHVVHFRQYKGDWLPDLVNLHLHAPGIVDVDETYTLQSVASSSPISVSVARDQQVRDYRLLGDSLTQRALLQSEQQHNQDILAYEWKGEFPSLEDLRQFQSKDHPGESTPDPGKSASLPLLGGIMALVGGVWMFKRRGSGAV